MNVTTINSLNAFERLNKIANFGIAGATFADADAVLLLENLKFLNYRNETRQIGFDLETTLAVLKVYHVK